MKKTALLFILLAFIAACSDQSSSVSRIQQVDADGIVGGELVERGSDASKMVVLVRGLYQEVEKRGNIINTTSHLQICTGSFISDDVILTAAHCIFTDPYKLQIVYTTNSNDDSAATSEVDRVLKNPRYTGSNSFSDGRMDDDIALIKIKGTRPADYQVLGLTPLPKMTEKFNLLSIGFGRTTGVTPTSEDPEQGAGQLRQTFSSAISFDPEMNYFSLDQTNGHGVCQGDSGGPAIINKDNQHFVIGVAKAVYREGADLMNSGPDDDTCKYKSAYISVPYYLKWISESLQQLEQKN